MYEDQVKLEEIFLKSSLTPNFLTDASLFNAKPIDKEKAENGVIGAYKAVNIDPPEVIEWVKSPTQLVKLAAQWEKGQMPYAYGDTRLPEVTFDEIKPYADSIYSVNNIYGSEYSSFCLFFQDTLSDSEVNSLQAIFDVLSNAHWWQPFETACILCERPIICERDSLARLHCEDGPAIAYLDGYKLYFWHGVPLPRWVYEEPEKFTIEAILKEEQDKVRKAMIEKYGENRLYNNLTV